MMVDVFSYMSKCYETGNLPMYFIPEMNLLQQYPVTSYENLNLEKEQERAETLDQILRQLANKKSMISIIVRYFPGSFQKTLNHRRYLCSMGDTFLIYKEMVMMIRNVRKMCYNFNSNFILNF